MSSKPKAIFFDLDETLVENVTSIQDLFANIYGDFNRDLGEHNRDAFFTTLRPIIGGFWNSMFLRDETPEQLLCQAFTDSILALNMHTNEQSKVLGERMFEQFCYNSRNNVRFHEGAEHTLEQLRNQGFTTGIITNGIERLQLGKIEQLDLQHKVDHVIVSAQARAHKPHAKVFELALQRANASAEHAWQIGDHATNDVAGAIRAGMSGVFYDPDGSRRAHAFNELNEDPTHTINDLREILEIV